MSKITLPNETYLQKDFVADHIVSIMNPALEWHPLLPKVKADSKAIWAMREPTSAASDTARRAPRQRTAGSKFVKVGVTALEEVTTSLQSYGLEIRVDEDAIRYTEGIDMIDRAFNRAAYYLVNDVNSQVGAALCSGVRQLQAGDKFFDKLTPVWSNPSADPVGDLQLLVADMEQDEYTYEATDVYLNRENFDELQRWIMSLDVVKAEREEVWGLPNFKQASVAIPVLGLTIHRTKSVPEGHLIAIDGRQPPATYYFGINPKFSAGESNDIGFNLHSYVDDDSHDTVFQFWTDFATLVKEPLAGLYYSGNKL